MPEQTQCPVFPQKQTHQKKLTDAHVSRFSVGDFDILLGAEEEESDDAIRAVARQALKTKIV